MYRRLKCILLIDDDEATNYLHRFILNRLDCTERLEIFQNAKEAMKYLAGQGKYHNNNPIPDMIFLDINMPSMNGWEFIEQFRKIKTGSPIVLVMLTTSLNPDDEFLSEKIPEISCFKNKPLTKKMVEGLLEEYFNDPDSSPGNYPREDFGPVTGTISS
jgi:CheY-like chemotaxis protein